MLVAGPGCRAPGGWAGCASAAWGSVGGGLAARGVGLWGGCPRDGLSWVGVWLARLCPRGRGRGRAALLRPEPGLGSTRGRRGWARPGVCWSTCICEAKANTQAALALGLGPALWTSDSRLLDQERKVTITIFKRLF